MWVFKVLREISGELAKGDWIDAERTRNYPRMLVCFYALAIALTLGFSHGLIDFTGKNVGTDFLGFWAAGKQALAGAPASPYDYAAQRAAERAALPWKPGAEVPFYAFLYPPMFLLAAAALAMLPYGWALLCWCAATLAAYLAALRRILPQRGALVAALAYPGAFVNLGNGQNGFALVGLFGFGLLLLETRPVAAGALFGLMAYKPQFGLLLPFALLAGAHWRAMLSAGVTVVLLAGLSFTVFGPSPWLAFLASLEPTRHDMLEQGAAGFEKFVSIFATMRLLGGGVSLAYAAQAACALAVAAATLPLWRRGKASLPLKGAALVTASLMIAPHALDYDLALLALPIAWLAELGLREGFHPWEKTTLLAAFLLPLISRLTGIGLNLAIAPFVMGALLWIIVRRAKETQ
jgi:hypothetical protein